MSTSSWATTPAAVLIAQRLMNRAKELDLRVSIEVHRDTCTETPEKTYGLADEYQKRTGELLRFTWDHSHLAIVKHLLPPYWPRLGVPLDLLAIADQFHFRPFNGHHCQVPVTDGRGRLTPEVRDYLPFVEKVIETWLARAGPGRELLVVAEMGPLWMGCTLHALPNSWDDAIVLRSEIDKLWKRANSVLETIETSNNL